MTATSTTEIRNIALVGHGATGKTTLADLMLFKAKAVTRLGSVDDKSSVFDADDDEKERKSSITSSIGHCVCHGKRITIIDTPGYPDFIGQVVGAMDAVETAIIVISATAGVEVNARRAFQIAKEEGHGCLVVINRCDADNVDFDEVLTQLQDVFGKQCIPVTVPDAVGPAFSKVLCTIAPTGEKGVCDPAQYNQQLLDSIVEADEALMERYLAGETLTPEEVAAGTHKAIAHGSLIPVYCTSAKKDIGVTELLEGIADWTPSPDEMMRKDADGKDIECDLNGPLIAQVFKARIDPFVARMNFLRIFSGTVKKDSTVIDQETGKEVKFGQIYIAQGNHLDPVDHGEAGDIVVVTKLEGLHVGDSLSTDGRRLPRIHFPKPMVGLAVAPKTSADQQKISGSLAKLHEEDPTIEITRDSQTHEMVVHGMSDLHLNILLHRVEKRDKLGMTYHAPRIPYRETCTMKGDGMYRHKKQSGGAGQFGEVHFRVHPFPRGTNPDEYFSHANFPSLRAFRIDDANHSAFVDCVSGGSVPNQFIPAIEKGVRERMEKGVLAGYHVQDVAVELYFGKSHDVDSNENAFRTAGSMCFREVFKTSKPVLLEPIVKLEVLIPGDKLGDITGDLNTRRGRMEGIDAAPGGYQVVKAHVPLAMVQDYSRGLSSMTGGQGSYSYEISHYEVVPAMEQQKIIANAKLVEEEA